MRESYAMLNEYEMIDKRLMEHVFSCLIITIIIIIVYDAWFKTYIQ